MILGHATLNVDERAKQRQMFSLWTHWPHQSRLQGQDSRYGLGRRGVRHCEEEEQDMLRNMLLDIVDLASFRVLSDNGDTMENDVVAGVQGNKDFKSDARRVVFQCWQRQTRWRKVFLAASGCF